MTASSDGAPRPPACTPGPDGSCSLCGDEAIPGRVRAVDALERLADVETAGGPLAVALDLVDGVVVGDVVLVHQGFAIGVVERA